MSDQWSGAQDGPLAWSDEELERFHDGELEAPLARALTRDLAGDERLRARLRTIQRCDEMVHRALTRPIGSPASTPTRVAQAIGSLRAPAAVRVIASVIVAGAGVVLLTLALRPSAGPPRATVADGLEDATIAESPPPRSRILVSLPGDSTGALFGDPLPEPQALRDVRVEALTALAEGDMGRALDLARSQSPADRRAALAALGLAMSVEERAKELLDAMTPGEQLEACEVWATDPRFRAATFSRLRSLAQSPELAPRVHELLDEMESQPELSAWVRSYRPRT